MSEKDIIEKYVIAILENKIRLEDVKKKYKNKVKELLDKYIYNDVMQDTQY